MTKTLAIFLLLSASAFAVLATPVTNNSITCSAGTCAVVTASAHNVSSSDPGFCILSSSQATDNICGTASVVTDATHYSFLSSTGVTCSSSCGTSQPAPVFMLRSSAPQFGQQNVSACMWTFVTTGIPISGGTSGCSAQFSGALQTEINAAIAAGSWVEIADTVGFSNSASVSTIEQYFQALQFSYQLQAIAPGNVSGHECDVTGCN